MAQRSQGGVLLNVLAECPPLALGFMSRHVAYWGSSGHLALRKTTRMTHRVDTSLKFLHRKLTIEPIPGPRFPDLILSNCKPRLTWSRALGKTGQLNHREATE